MNDQHGPLLVYLKDMKRIPQDTDPAQPSPGLLFGHGCRRGQAFWMKLQEVSRENGPPKLDLTMGDEISSCPGRSSHRRHQLLHTAVLLVSSPSASETRSGSRSASAPRDRHPEAIGMQRPRVMAVCI